MAESWGIKEEARRHLPHYSRPEGKVAWSRVRRMESSNGTAICAEAKC